MAVTRIYNISLKHTYRNHNQAERLKQIFHRTESLPIVSETLQELLVVHFLSGQIGSLNSLSLCSRPLLCYFNEE